jgi:hypothetical protein
MGRMHDGLSLTARIILGLVLLVAGALGAGIVYAHVAGRTTSEPPRG